MNILLLNGPNLNLLGKREPYLYGYTTLAEIESAAIAQATTVGARIDCFQSNHEGVLIDQIHAAVEEGIDAIVINPGGLTHTSIALRDALVCVGTPFIEVHLSNIYQREHFRHHSFLSEKAIGTIIGLGADGYRMAIEYILTRRQL